MRRTFFPVLCLAVCLSGGCSMSSERVRQADHFAAPTPEPTARLYFVRTRQSKLYLFRGAALTIDGERAGSVGFGTVVYRDVLPGVRGISVSTWDAPGRCMQRVAVEAGETLYFEVAPRSESFHAYVAGDVAATLVSRSAVAGAVGGLMGLMYESRQAECGGPFAIAPLDATMARKRMTHLALMLPPRPTATRPANADTREQGLVERRCGTSVPEQAGKGHERRADRLQHEAAEGDT